jgi:hypothetical protein
MMVIYSFSNIMDQILTLLLSKAASLEVRLVRLRSKSRDLLLPNIIIVTLPAAHDLYNYNINLSAMDLSRPLTTVAISNSNHFPEVCF